MHFNFRCVHRKDEIYNPPEAGSGFAPVVYPQLVVPCEPLTGGILTRFLNHLRCRSSRSTPSSPQMSDLLTLISKAETSHPTENIHFYPRSRSFSHCPRLVIRGEGRECGSTGKSNQHRTEPLQPMAAQTTCPPHAPYSDHRGIMFMCRWKILKVKKVKVCTNRSSSVPQRTLLLKRLASSPASNYVTSRHHTVTESHICIIWHFLTFFPQILKCIYSYHQFIYRQLRWTDKNPSLYLPKISFLYSLKKIIDLHLFTHWNIQTHLSCTNTFLPPSLSLSILWRLPRRSKLFLALNRATDFNAWDFKDPVIPTPPCQVLFWLLSFECIMVVSCFSKCSTSSRFSKTHKTPDFAINYSQRTEIRRQRGWRECF